MRDQKQTTEWENNSITYLTKKRFVCRIISKLLQMNNKNAHYILIIEKLGKHFNHGLLSSFYHQIVFLARTGLFCLFCVMYLNAWASLVAQLVKNLPAMQETLVCSWVGRILWRRVRVPTPVFMGFPHGLAGK